MPNWEPIFNNEDKQPAGTVKAKWCGYGITTYETVPSEYKTKTGIRGVSACYVNKETLEVWDDHAMSRPDYKGKADLIIKEEQTVEARVKRAFIDKSLSPKSTLAIKLESANGQVTDYYASNYFWRKFNVKVAEAIASLSSMKPRSKTWSISLNYERGVSSVLSATGLNSPDLARVKEALDSHLSEATGGLKSRGRPRTRARTAEDKPIPKQRPKKNSIPGTQKISKPVKPSTVRIAPAAPKVPVPKIKAPKPVINKPSAPRSVKDEDFDDDAHVDLIDGPKLAAPVQQPEEFSLLELEKIIRKQFERSASELGAGAWEIVLRNYRSRMPASFLEKYKQQINEAQRPNTVRASALDVVESLLNLKWRVKRG